MAPSFGCAFSSTGADGAPAGIPALNPGAETVICAAGTEGGPWKRLLDTFESDGGAEIAVAAGAVWALPAHTLVLFTSCGT